MSGTVYQVNRKPETPGERGIPKAPVEEAVVTVEGVVGDFNRWRHEKSNDSPDSALLILPLEIIRDLQTDWPVEPGHLGENVTTQGMAYSDFAPGRRFRIGEVEVQITKQANPCALLYPLPYAGEENGPALLETLVDRRGWRARVLKEGTIRPGDPIKPLAD
jgi:MOSC domain-containing protein YiiM